MLCVLTVYVCVCVLCCVCVCSDVCGGVGGQSVCAEGGLGVSMHTM